MRGSKHKINFFIINFFLPQQKYLLATNIMSTRQHFQILKLIVQLLAAFFCCVLFLHAFQHVLLFARIQSNKKYKNWKFGLKELNNNKKHTQKQLTLPQNGVAIDFRLALSIFCQYYQFLLVFIRQQTYNLFHLFFFSSEQQRIFSSTIFFVRLWSLFSPLQQISFFFFLS